MKIFCRIFFLLISFTFFFNYSLQSTDYGSDTQSSIVRPFNVSGTDNYIKAFGWPKYGIFYLDGGVTCTFQSVYPVAGPLDLQGGTLYLDSDLVLTNTASISSLGSIKAYNHVVELSESTTDLRLTGTSGEIVLSLIARETEGQDINSVDWSHDDNYLASALDSNGDELFVYSFDGSVLTNLAGFDLVGDGYSVRWHPSATSPYYLAMGGFKTNAELRIFSFTTGTNVLAVTDTVNLGGSVYSTAWHPSGNYLGVGSLDVTQEIIVYTFSGGTLSSPVAVNLTPDRAVSQDAMCWAPAGNGSYLVVGVADDGGVSPELLLYYFDGATMTLTANVNVGDTVRSLDWSSTGSYIAVGLAGSDTGLRVYQHKIWNGTLTEATRLDETDSVLSVGWRSDGQKLAVGLASGGVTEFRNYSFDAVTTPTLSLDVGINAVNSVNSVRYSNDGEYIARGDDSNFVSIYKTSETAFAFENVNLFLNSNLTLRTPVSFDGDCVINGRGNNFIFADDGAINIKPDSLVTFRLVSLDFDKTSAIQFESHTSNMRIEDSKMILNSDVIIGDGSMNIGGEVVIKGPYTLNYSSLYTSTIDVFSELKFENGATLEIGRSPSVSTPPLEFANDTSFLSFDNANLNITGSGLQLKRGELDVFGQCIFDVSSSDTNFGIVFGDGTAVNDTMLNIKMGGNLILDSGAMVMNDYSSDKFNFNGSASEITLRDGSLLYFNRTSNLTDGLISTSTGANLSVLDGKYLTMNNTCIDNLVTRLNFCLTGTMETLNSVILDQDDELHVVQGDLDITITVSRGGNKISGIGSLTGGMILVDENSTLTWDVESKIAAEEVFQLNGGSFVLGRDSGFIHRIEFNQIGIVNLQSATFEFGPQETTFTGDLYWIGDGATLRFNNDVDLDGTWTFSGNVVIDGNNYTLDLNSTSSIILERGANVTFKNITLKNLSRQNCITCLDDNCKITLNHTQMLLADDYLFDKGSIFIYHDSVLSSQGDFDTIYTFTYASTQTSTLDYFCRFRVGDRTRFSIGRQDSSITTPARQPLVFVDPTSKLILDGGTLHITSSGMILSKGVLNVDDSSILEIENTKNDFGLILGDGTQANDFKFEINPGVKISLNSGRLVYNNFSDDKLVFDSNSSTIAVNVEYGIYVQRDFTIRDGTYSLPYPELITILINPAADYIAHNLHFIDDTGVQDFVLTGTVAVLPCLILDSYDSIKINPGKLSRNLCCENDNNLIIGSGELDGDLYFTDQNSSLTWNLRNNIKRDVYLNGGRIRFANNSAIEDSYSFKNTGTIDLTTYNLNLGPASTEWSGGLYWIGDGSTLRFNNDIDLDGTWTFSGNVIIDGNDYALDLNSTSSIILERGANVTFKNITLKNLSRQNCITCLDDNCKITLNHTQMLLADDYLFDKGSIFIYHDSVLSSQGDFDTIYTFTYASTQTSTLDYFCTFKVGDRTRFSIGRQDSSITTPTRQPLVFGDATSTLLLDGGTLHITSSGMILTKGELSSNKFSKIEIENNKVEYSLVLGDGTEYNDFAVLIGGDSTLAINNGKLFYNNFSSTNRFKFANSSAVLEVDVSEGLTLLKDLTLSSGTIKVGQTGTVAGSILTMNDFTGIIVDPYCVFYMTGDFYGNFFHFNNNNYFSILEGRYLKPIYVDSGTVSIAGTGILSGGFILRNSGVALNLQQVSSMASDIELNGGTLTLDENLDFIGDKKITGSGTINLNERKLSFGTESLLFTEPIYWQSSSGMDLNSRTTLGTTWTFNGVCNLNGNGNILELMPGGKLVVDYTSTLFLTDIVIKGLRGVDETKNLLLMNDNSKIFMSNVYIELDDNFSTTIGGVFIEGPTTFGLKNCDWLLDSDASLTVDGVTLWQDSLDNVSGGKIRFGSGSIDNYLTLLSSGTIKTLVSLDVISSDTSFLQDQIINNSNAIVSLDVASLIPYVVGNSNSIVFMSDVVETATNNISYNSSAIVVLEEQVKENSNAILNLEDQVEANSNAIMWHDEQIRWNSNAIVSLDATALADWIRWNSSAILNSDGKTAITKILLGTSLNVDLVLDQSVHIDPDERINVDGNITIDGRGATLVFSDPNNPQFIVQPGYSVVLKNVQLDRISQNTLNLMYRTTPIIGTDFCDLTEGQLIIGENVIFGLNENITFSQGLIQLQNHSVTGNPQTFRIRGVDGTKKFIINPSSGYRAAIECFTGIANNGALRRNVDRVKLISGLYQYEPVLLKLEQNTLGVQAIQLSGIQHIAHSVGAIYAGAIGLIGEAAVDVGDTNYYLTAAQKEIRKEECDNIFQAQGLDNKLRLLKDDLKLTGQLLFGSTGENVVSVDTLLTERIQGTVTEPVRPPILNLGTNFLDLTSRDRLNPHRSGFARLIFEDPVIRINNDTNAFWVYENSYLGGQRVEVTGDAIHNGYDPASDSRPFILDVLQLVRYPENSSEPALISEFESILGFRSFEDEIFRTPHAKYLTALDLEAQLEQEKYEQFFKSTRNLISKSIPRRNLEELKDVLGMDDLSLDEIEKELLRTIQPPASDANIQSFINQDDMSGFDSLGNIVLENTTMTNFTVKESAALNLSLVSGSAIKLRSAEATTFKSGDVLNVQGKGNEIWVSNTLNINGDLCFEADSQLTIKLVTDDAKVVFGANSVIDLELNVEFSIEGNGRVEFGDGSVINLKGTRVYPEQYPSLIIKDRAKITPASGGAVTIKGIGNLIVLDSGKIIAQATDGNKTWIFGDSFVDKIHTSVIGTGMMQLSGSGDYKGRLSIQNTEATISVLQGGIIDVDDGGWLEINSNNGIISKGEFTSFEIDSGCFLYLSGTGKLTFADNLGARTTSWNSKNAIIRGDGFVGFVSGTPATGYSNLSFTGKIQSDNSNILFKDDSIYPSNLVRRLINESSDLIAAVQFTNEENKQILRLKNGKQIEVVSGDILLSEDQSGNVRGMNSDDIEVLYAINGTRRVIN